MRNNKANMFSINAPTPVTDYFITEWTVGTNQFIELPLSSSGVYDFSIDWGDGTPIQNITSWNQPEKNHSFAVAGSYDVKILGACDYFIVNNGTARTWITKVKQWGVNPFTNLNFYGCLNMYNITATDTPVFNVGASIVSLFRDCINLSNVSNLENWETSNVSGATLSYTFSNCKVNQNINNWNVSGVTSLNFCFLNNSDFNQPLNLWNTSNIDNFNGVFYNATSFNQPLNSWNVSSATTLASMFRNSDFNQPLNSWNSPLNTSLGGTFHSTPFNQNIDSWETSNVTNFSYTFYNCQTFDQPLNSWNVAKATTTTLMFGVCRVFNQPLTNWVFSSLWTQAVSMFNGCYLFNQEINQFNTSGLLTLNGMLRDCKVFNKPLNLWNTSSCTYFGSFLRGALVFDQNISNFDFSNVTYATSMLASVPLSVPNYDALLISLGTQTLQSNVTLSANLCRYSFESSASIARDNVIANYNWTFDDGLPYYNIGDDIINNGTFDLPNTVWNLGVNWDISGGKLNAVVGTDRCFQSIAGKGILGKTYRVTYTISNYVSGSVKMDVGNAGNGSVSVGNGTFTHDTVFAGATNLYINQVGRAFVGSVDNLTVVRLD